MKCFSVLLLIVMLCGCAPIADTPMLLDATWRGTTITLLTSSGPMYFAAPRNSASDQIAIATHVVYKNDHWYIWDGNYREEIFVMDTQ